MCLSISIYYIFTNHINIKFVSIWTILLSYNILITVCAVAFTRNKLNQRCSRRELNDIGLGIVVKKINEKYLLWFRTLTFL